MDSALRGNPVNVADSIRCIEDYIESRTGESVRIKNPESYALNGNDMYNFNVQLGMVHEAFFYVCVQYKEGKYEPK